MDIRLSNSTVNFFQSHHYEGQVLSNPFVNEATVPDYNLYGAYHAYGHGQPFGHQGHQAPWADYGQGPVQPCLYSPTSPASRVAYHSFDEAKPATISDGDSLDQQGQVYHPTPGRHSPEPKEGDYHGDHYIEPGSLVDYGHLDQDTEPKNPTKANKKERRRTVSINSAFSNLRDCIPNVPTDTKLSKIKTLRLATSYIGYLMALLDNGQENDQLCPGLEGFKVDLQRFKRGSKGENKALYQQKLLEEQERAKYMPRKGKGRTGWPQHVWADELKVQDGGNKRPN